jgi:3-isopropylmalate/(R)-2-methylmalate dehydratase large subunit
MNAKKTLFDKIWDAHIVTKMKDGPSVIYIDKHLIHEVTSPQAFAGLESRNLSVFRPKQTMATADHNVPTINQHLPVPEILSRMQVEKLEENCRNHSITCFGLGHPYQGIVHVIAPELGFTLPGMTLVCGDSHTSTHGGFGAIAFGIGSSEVEQVFASQCILQEKPRLMKIEIEGSLQAGVTAKDVILYVLSELGTNGATGHFIEYTGPLIKSLTMEERMTICNMSIELGARGGLIAPDQTTFQYLQGKPFAPDGQQFEIAQSHWETLFTDEGAFFDASFSFNITDLAPMVTYGTNPGMAVQVSGYIPVQQDESGTKALDYMKWAEGDKISSRNVNYVFIGSCTNSRIEDLRAAARIVKGKHIAKTVKAFVVPGSRLVRDQACREGLDLIFMEAGFSFREPGCSACLGMNEDKIPPGKLCVSTSNRNFEGRQGPGSITILASPLTAAASALSGRISDAREFFN